MTIQSRQLLILMTVCRKIYFSILVIFLSTLVRADEVLYLSCHGIAKDTSMNIILKEVENDFLLNKTALTIQQVITGMSEEENSNLRHNVKETATQFISENGRVAINKHCSGIVNLAT
jgi:hypothetical protein